MTTVAYRNGVLAADSQFMVNGWKQPHAAQAAMYMGADAVRAVEIASLLDDATGGAVASMGCERR